MAHETEWTPAEAHAAAAVDEAAAALWYDVRSSIARSFVVLGEALVRTGATLGASRAAVRSADRRLYRSAVAAASPSPTIAGWQRRRVEHARRLQRVSRLRAREPRDLVRARVAASRVGGRR